MCMKWSTRQSAPCATSRHMTFRCTGVSAVWCLFLVARNAIFCTVTFMDGDSGEVIVSLTRDRRNYGLSAQAMEPFLTKEILTYLKDHGVDFESIAHDDNKAVGKLVQQHVNADNTKPLDQLDCLHYVKLLLKVVILFLKVRSGVRSLVVTTVLNFKLAGLKRLAAALLLIGLKTVKQLQKQVDLSTREAQFLKSQRFILGLPGRGALSLWSFDHFARGRSVLKP